MARTNLKLGGLGRAVGENNDSTSTTRLAADGRGSAAQTSMRGDFAVDEIVGPIINDTTPNENSSHIITVNYNTTGVLFFSRIANQPANFFWSEVLNASSYTLLANQDYTCPCSMAVVSSNVTCMIAARQVDYYNINATGYNTTIYEVFTIQNSGGGGRSDIRWKQNIERVGTSQLGLPIFEFEYIDASHGEGKFRGTIAQELVKNDYAHATYLDKDGYYWVDYNKIDISFESC
tara:strand:+ start:469 stop:1170 length:702 start_codon:yes stop_codon:yes gene_type:complete